MLRTSWNSHKLNKHNNVDVGYSYLSYENDLHNYKQNTIGGNLISVKQNNGVVKIDINGNDENPFSTILKPSSKVIS
jgi:hypothetical protein